jgi:small-conductance mechanosensitive channel/CRP-like cAMP-binding protein
MVYNPLVIAGVAALAVTLALLVAIRSRFIRARLQFSLWLLLAFLVLEAAVSQSLGDVPLLSALARLVFVLALISLAVATLANSWREDRPSDRFPAIVQDFAVIGFFLVISTVLMKEQLLTTSAVGAVVVGFALQDTLGNLFSGLAIQIEKPFRVGHWVAVGDREGQVQEITWRATKLRTKAGQFLIVPNGVISKEAILNYSEPTLPTRLEVEVGASYASPPNIVKAAIREALSNAPLTLKAPSPSILLFDFGDSSIVYKIQFWVGDYSVDQQARDQVRSNIWYSFRRHNIEIPYPMQIQFEREETPLRTDTDIANAAEQLGAIELFSTLPAEARLALARGAGEHLFCAGESIVRQDDPGSSMFIVLNGRVTVVLEPSGQHVAYIEAGGLFGEMSMLTGDPRTATVRAIDDVRVLELGSDQFRELALAHPGLVEHISTVVARRRVGLDEARAAASAVSHAAAVPANLLGRIRRFLRLPGN